MMPFSPSRLFVFSSLLLFQACLNNEMTSSDARQDGSDVVPESGDTNVPDVREVSDVEQEAPEVQSPRDEDTEPGADAQLEADVAYVPAYPVGVTDIAPDPNSTRRVRVVIPGSVVEQPPRALVVVLHGGGGTGLDVSEPGQHPLAVFRDVAERERFVVAYPEGSAARDGKLGWTDCRADNLQASDADDVGFLRTAIALLHDEFDLTPAQTFMAGGSNGGQMTLAFAAHHADLLGAIAVSSANLPETPLEGACANGPSQPIAALFTHGSADTAMPYDGGCVANLGGNCARGRVIGAEATRDAWLSLNGLASTATLQNVVDISTDDAGSADSFVYDGAAPVVWWRLNGAGHPSPSIAVQVAPNPYNGVQNNDVEFAELAWQFFAQQLNPSAIAP
jgi:polyhydroxybutyrate depolymerase